VIQTARGFSPAIIAASTWFDRKTDFEMASFFIEQFGCRATQADAAAIERQLLGRGLKVSADAGSADVVVINTCTVTAAADLQARQAIRAIHRENPAARVIVTGCYAQRAPEEIAELEGVSWVVGNSHKPEVPRLVSDLTPGPPGTPLSRLASWRAPFETVALAADAPASHAFIPLSAINYNAPSPRKPRAEILTGNIREHRELLVAPVEGGEAGHTRPVLKIQDGCDRHCSYCVIPNVRGRSRSLAPCAVIEEIRKLCGLGAREIVLSGIDLGNYGCDLVHRVRLVDLVRRILDETSVERLRLSSVEPMDVTEDLIAIFAGNERTARHFHMPLQSGSDRILAAMHRWYRAEHYARRVDLVREKLPDAAIGADVIAGFPGETEEDHRATLALIERLPLTYLHVFSFSARPGTPAAELREQVPEPIIDRRASELRALGEKKRAAFQARQAGVHLQVLTLKRTGEDSTGPWTKAIASNYLNVRVSGVYPPNEFLGVRIAGLRDGNLTGAI
jgi:threonylcarbamoyladenosine tRNA methylthiotransferase MtaB